MASLADMIGAARSGPVQNSVSKFGGLCTMPFTQCKPPVSTYISRDKNTEIGVCESMSAHWIKFHSEGGSLWNWLLLGGRVNLDKLTGSIMPLQAKGIIGDQDDVTEKWLKRHGILRVRTSKLGYGSSQTRYFFQQFAGGYEETVDSGRTKVLSCNDLAAAILRDDTLGAGSYKKIYIKGKFGAHVMAAWVAEDVAFFDANFGEFWFDTPEKFKKWFTGKFWSSSIYSIGLSGQFEIRTYAKSIGLH